MELPKGFLLFLFLILKIPYLSLVALHVANHYNRIIMILLHNIISVLVGITYNFISFVYFFLKTEFKVSIVDSFLLLFDKFTALIMSFSLFVSNSSQFTLKLGSDTFSNLKIICTSVHVLHLFGLVSFYLSKYIIISLCIKDPNRLIWINVHACDALLFFKVLWWVILSFK